MSRAVIYERYGGPDVLELRDVPDPHAGPGEIRIRVAAVGLNAMDPAFAAMPELAARFNITLPSGFGYDFAGSVDEVGDGADGFTVGDRVYGGVMERAAADFVVMKTPPGADGVLFHTPDGLSDAVAEHAIHRRRHRGRRPGGAQSRTRRHGSRRWRCGRGRRFRRTAGSAHRRDRVIGTASSSTFPFLRELGASPSPTEPASRIAYGQSLPAASPPPLTYSAPRPSKPRSALGLAPEPHRRHRRRPQPSRRRTRGLRQRRGTRRSAPDRRRDPRT